MEEKKEDKQEKETLEKVVKGRVKPVIDKAMKKFLGATVTEIGTDISDRIARSPVVEFEIDTSMKFRQAKKLFKKYYFVKLLKKYLGNISKAADVSGVDRRSIHRFIKEFKIDTEKIRKEVRKIEYLREDEIKDIIEGTLEEYSGVINPERLKTMYGNVEQISKRIIQDLPEAPQTFKEAEKEFERKFIAKSLSENNNNISKTARKLGIRYETLHRKMFSLGIRR